MSSSQLKEEFIKAYGSEPEALFFCPGRVNLIGEHIDYNGGRVMPCAISKGTYLAIGRNTEKRLVFKSLNFSEEASLHLQSSYSKTGSEWYNYPLGVIHHLIEAGHELPGFNMLFYGNLPVGAGLSSSASIETVTGYAVAALSGIEISRVDLALLGKKVENEFIGVNSGIMDQFAVAMGKSEKAILLNCDTLEYEYLPLEIGDYTLAIINSNKKRTLADSKYNERFAECGRALKALKKEMNVTHLCDISPEQFDAHRSVIDEEVLEKRALHVITENARVKEAAKALKNGELGLFGELMYASHQSLQELYEVSGRELDAIVQFCKGYEDCIGARMTGAGFGGCAIALVKKDQFDDFANQLTSYYKKTIGYAPEIFSSEVGEGVREM